MSSDPRLFVEARPVGTRIAFVGRHQEHLAIDGVRSNGVGQVQAPDRVGRDLDGGGAGVGVGAAVFVAGVQAHARHAVVLEAQRPDGQHLGAGDVHHSHRIVLLQGDVSGGTALVDGDVLGLEVLRCRGSRAIDPHPLSTQLSFLAVEGLEVSGGHRGLASAVDRDHADGAFRVGGIGLTVAVGLTFVSHQQIAPIGCEGHHVRLRAHRYHFELPQIGRAVEGHHARVGLGRGLDGQGHKTVVHRDAVDTCAE